MISETEAQSYLAASRLAYIDSLVVGPLGYEVVREFNDSETGFHAVAFKNANNEYVIAFRGTQPNFQDAYTDLNLGWPQWNRNREEVLDFLRGLEGQLTSVSFTGHSLGGALAQYAAYEYANEADPATITLTTFNAFGGVQGIVQNLAPGQSYDSTRLAGIDVNHFREASDMVSRLGEGHVGGNVRVIDFLTPDFIAAHRLETSFLNPTNAGYQLTALPFATPNYLHVSTGQQLGAALGNLFNDGTYKELEAALRTTGALLLVLQLAPTNEIDQVMDAMFPQYAKVNWGTVRSILPVSGGAVVLGGAGLILAAGVYEGVQGATERLAEVKTFLGRSLGESFDSLNALPTGEAGLRMSVYLAATSGIGLAGSTLGQALSGLTIDHAQLTTHLLSGANWLTDSMDYFRAQANAAGQNAADFSARLASGIYQEAGALAGAATDFLTNTTTILETFLFDTANGISNAVSEFLHDVPDSLFDLGRTLSFAELNPFTTAYAQALEDPRLDSDLRTALEEAQQIVQEAGQTVVIQKDMGPNPFHTPGFVPGGASSATVEEKLGEVFRLSLPFAAGAGGQRVSLRLQGPQPDQLSVLTTDGVQQIGANGAVEVMVPEGADQVLFTLVVSDEVSADATVTLSATLVDVNGDATHTPQMESTISVKAFVGNTDGGYEPWVEDYSHVTDPTVSLPLGVGGFYHQTLRGGAGPDDLNGWAGYGDDTLYGNGGDDWIFGGYGHDRLYGGTGNDRLLADPYDYHPDPVARPSPLLPPPTLDGKDYADGGEGNDRIGGGGNDDRLIGGAGDDEIWGDALTRGTRIDNPDGSQTFVSLTGVLVPGDDVLEGGDGNDRLSGDGGDDLLYGGPGNDLLVGDTQQGLELLFPMAPGDDYLAGGDGNDELQGNAGHDVLLGGAGEDRLYGDDPGVGLAEEGNDWLEGGDGADFLAGRGGEDTLIGGNDADVLFADAGDDTLIGGEGDDIGFGGDGDDDISAGGGADQFDGGAGDDVLFGDDGDDLLIGGDGLDELDGGADHDLLIGGADDDALFGRDGNDELQGNAGSDLLVGDAGDDRIFGQEGDDELVGGDGSDGLRGDDGDDLIDGGAGDDILVGDADGQIGGSGGIDILAGGAGNDTLVGGGGQDTYLYEIGDGFDVIVEGAGEGNRLVFGAGISPSAIIAAVGPDDSLILRTSNEEHAVEIKNFVTNNLNGTHPIEFFQFADGTILTYSQVAAGGLAVSGGLGNDQLSGTAQGEKIFGGAGGDTVNAGGGNDVLIGGTGNDRLFGEAGQDTYIFAKGGGFDTIEDTPEEGNRLIFGSGISQPDLSLGFKQVSIPGEGGEEEGGDPGTVLNYLVVRTGTSGDAVEIQWVDPAVQSASLGVDQFVFADGTVLTSAQLLAPGLELVGTAGFDILDGQAIYRTIRGLAGDDVLIGGMIDNVLVGDDGRDVLIANGGSDQLSGGMGDDVLRGGEGNDVLNGEAGHDSLEGEAGHDVLVGGIGDDQLYGGEGNDTYRFSLGDGLDTLVDFGPSTDTDTVIFGSGLTYEVLTLKADFGQILLKVGGGSDGIYIGNTFDVSGSQTIERFQFSDGSTLNVTDLLAGGFELDGTDFDDFLSGTNVGDRFRGGLGNDRLEGGDGNDSYFFNVGDGIDTIIDTAAVGVGNEVVFGPGVTSYDLRLDLAADQSDPNLSDLLLRVGTNGDAIQLDTFDPNNVLGPRTIQSARFADGSTLTYEQLLAQGFDLTGTDGDDRIIGTNIVDRIVGSAGVDMLRGGLGDDELDGGADNDRLIGGQGNDTYVFEPGAGQDTILEFQGSLDAIRMAPGVTPSDVVVTRNNNDLVLSLGGGADRLTVSFYFLAPPLQIELVQFADGTVWDQAFIENLTRPVITGTEGPDSLIGTSGDDRLAGLAGDDQLIGSAGNDQLDGGAGVDQSAGGPGNDTYLIDEPGDVVTELSNEGVDTVQTNVTRALEAQVENLTLAGTADLNGTGNELDNTLTGNSGANVLSGGTGNDTYVVGAGDTVTELVGEGTDTVQTGISVTLGANVENLTLTGNAPLIGIGNNLDNVLKADGLFSTLVGGDGNDTYVIGLNGDDDILVETATGGIDTVIASHDYRLPAYIENLTLVDPRIPDFSIFSLVPYVFSEQSLTGHGNDLGNTLIGGRANNVLDGGLGADTLIGDKGDDTYVVDNIADIVIEQMNEGTDTIQSSKTYTLSANVENLTLSGTSSINGTGNALNNYMQGNDAPNVLEGGVGNDGLQGLAGADTYLFGRGAGQDIVLDSSLNGEIDTIQFDSTVITDEVDVYRNGFNLELLIRGTTDELTLVSFFGSSEYGEKQVRFADGTAWNSAELSSRAVIGTTITGTFESETISGTDGHDLLIGSAGNDVLTGGRGKDTLYGDVTFQPFSGNQVIGDDTLQGGAGDDTLTDFRGTNLFDGGSGDDTLILGTGVDRVLFGRGSGVDQVALDNNRNDIDIIEMAAEITPAEVEMTWRSPSVVDILISDSGDRLTVQLSTDWFAVGPETAQGIVQFSDGTQRSLAWSSLNVGIPTATLSDDVLGASFPSALAGSDGDDTYLLGSSGVSGDYAVIEEPAEGIDTVQSVLDYTLLANVENLFLVKFTADNGVGNELDNLIVGNTRDNILDGGAGNDVVVGGFFRSVEEFFLYETGSDILIGGTGDDVLMADGGNIVFAVDGADSEWLFLGGGSKIRENVPRLADDLFIGGTGNDTYLVHSQQQTVAEFEHEGIDTVKTTISYLLGEHVENLVLVSPPMVFDDEDNVIPPPPLNGTGNEVDNVLIGSEDANVLSGLTGDDTLAGRLGNDSLRGGTGHDAYLFNLGDGIDTIEDVAAAGQGNRIQFGVGISRNDLTVTQDEVARTLTIQLGASGTDGLVLTNFDLTGVNGTPVVETLAFADGSTTSLAGFFGPTITEGNDTITTGAGDDVINALAGDDIVDAGAGNDLIAGGTGNDTLTGGPGDDTYVYNSNDGVDTINDTSLPNDPNTLEFGTGIDPADLSLDLGSLMIRIGPTGDALHLSHFDPDNVLGPRTIETFRFADGTVLSYDELVQRGFDLTGTDGNDLIMGTNVVDRIAGFAGDDILAGGRGNDLLTGGVGHDTYRFNLGDGIETIDDRVLLGAGNRIQFGAGISLNDLIFTQDEAARTLTIQVGTSGTDRLVLANFDPRGTNGSLVVSALEFADGNVVNLVDLYPPNHAPTVAVPMADQTAAEDSFFTFTVPASSFTDADVSHGDALVYDASLANGNPLPVWLSFDPITRAFSGMPGAGDAGVLQVTVTATDTKAVSTKDRFALTVSGPLPQTLTGTAGSDTLTGGRGDDTLGGLGGNDSLNGGLGNDLLDGGTGTDTMHGGIGNDTYVVDASGDVVMELADEGIDTVHASLFMYTLGANIENLALVGTGPSMGIGNALSNRLTGNSGANLLDGKTGADTMVGGAGNDLYMVDQDSDVVIEAASEGSDTVSTSVTYSLALNVENLVLTGSAAINGTGNELDNYLTGNNVANVFTGGVGDDTYVIGAGDTVVEAVEGGTDTVISTVAHTLGSNVENLTLVGFNASNGAGNELDNVLNGVLNLAGNTLTGGAGDDTYVIGSGDNVVEAAGEGTDTVQTSLSHTLGANVEHLILTGTSAINGTGNALDNVLTGNGANNRLTGGDGHDLLGGKAGSDTLIGGTGNDTYLFSRGDGQDLVRDNSGSTDKLLYGSGIDPLDLVLSRQANDLRLAIHGSLDYVTVHNWYTSSANRAETIQAGNGDTLLNTQVDQLIQAMAQFSQQTGLTWDEGIDQRPQEVQAVLAASWQ